MKYDCPVDSRLPPAGRRQYLYFLHTITSKSIDLQYNGQINLALHPENGIMVKTIWERQT